MDCKHWTTTLTLIIRISRHCLLKLLEHLNNLLKPGSLPKNEKLGQLCFHAEAACILSLAQEERSGLLLHFLRRRSVLGFFSYWFGLWESCYDDSQEVQNKHVNQLNPPSHFCWECKHAAFGSTFTVILVIKATSCESQHFVKGWYNFSHTQHARTVPLLQTLKYIRQLKTP